MSQQTVADSDADSIDVVKVIGAPGTGKTTTMIGNVGLEMDGLFIDNMDEYGLDEQMMVTYTNSGVDEVIERLYQMTDHYKKDIENRVTTIHSRCWSTLGKNHNNLVNWRNEKAFCEDAGLEYGFEDDDADDAMAGDDENAGNALIQIYGWLKSNRLPLSEHDQYPNVWPGDRPLGPLLKAWDRYKEENDLFDYADLIEEVVEMNVSVLRQAGLGDTDIDDDVEYLKSVREDPDALRKKKAMRGNHGFIDTRVLYVDECQDLTKLQWSWYLCQKLVADEVYIGFDEDQCLPPEETVTKVNGGEVEIQDIEVGDRVQAMEGGGDCGYHEVTNVARTPSMEQTLVKYTTDSGRTATVTDNHKVFARVPEETGDMHYVYLMESADGRWRIGKSSEPRRRFRVEKGAQKCVLLQAFEDEVDALLAEQVWSLNYSIPTTTFTPRKGEVVSVLQDNLHEQVDTDITGLVKETNVRVGRPVMTKQAGSRGDETAVAYLTMCNRWRASPSHQIKTQTSSNAIKSQLDEIDGLNVVNENGDSVRYQADSVDYDEVSRIARLIDNTTDATLVTRMFADDERYDYPVIPARNLVEGMVVPVVDDGTVTRETITNIETETRDTAVYDLTVEGVHNFTTNGVGVHNTIYGWSGADPRQPLNEEGEVELLEKTYRVPRAVWQVCDSCIRQVEDRHEKDVEPVDEEGQFVPLRNPTGGQLTKHIDEAIQEYDEDVLILFRARFHIDEFRKDLHAAGIPYDNMSTFDTWGQDLKKLRKPLGKLNQGQPVNPDGVKLLLDEADDDNIDGTREGQKANIFGMSMPEDVEEMFNVPGYGNFVTWYVGELDDDDYNWYEREALKHNVLKGKTGYDPDQVRIGTIHSAKGKEAGTVILGTDSTPTIISNMASDVGRSEPAHGMGSAISDDERRVMYVGMSRASRKLVMAEGAVTNDAKLRINALVNDDEDDE